MKAQFPVGIEFRAVTLRGAPMPGYFVSAFGQVWSARAGRVLKDYSAGVRYRGVALRVNGKTVRAMVHWLVAEAFLGPRPSGADVCHANGDRTDNRASNLRYDTRSANLADRESHGTSQRGACNPAAKLTDAQAGELRSRRAAGESLKTLAVAFGVRESTVSRIANGVRRST